ncbi:alpha-galactosidase [Streptomyces vietnamensis]|uniref:alpha-galactosidase n=1 Tax=Streptomyces vietnamensis TaxID=362257 RepID=UPI0037A74AA3
MERTDRVWASDTNDPVERQRIQRYTGLFVPPELMGSHVGAATAHTTGRTSPLPIRLATALFGHAGIEWDITTCAEEELDRLARWTGLYKRLRPLLHGGRTVRVDHPDPSAYLHGVASEDQRHSVFALLQAESSEGSVAPRLRLPGLAPGTTYDVSVCRDFQAASSHPSTAVPWITEGSVRVSGAALAAVGLAAPLLDPEQCLVLEIRAELGADDGMGVRGATRGSPFTCPAGPSQPPRGHCRCHYAKIRAIHGPDRGSAPSAVTENVHRV